MSKIKQMWDNQKVWWQNLPKKQKANLVGAFFFGIGIAMLSIFLHVYYSTINLVDKTLSLAIVVSGVSIFSFLGLFGLMRYRFYLEQRSKSLEKGL